MKTHLDYIDKTQVTNEYAVTFNVTLSDSEKPNQPLVKFYDTRYTDKQGWELGQPVSSYYASTLMGRDSFLNKDNPRDHGIMLWGDTREWSINRDNKCFILDWLESLEDNGKTEIKGL